MKQAHFSIYMFPYQKIESLKSMFPNIISVLETSTPFPRQTSTRNIMGFVAELDIGLARGRGRELALKFTVLCCSSVFVERLLESGHDPSGERVLRQINSYSYCITVSC